MEFFLPATSLGDHGFEPASFLEGGVEHGPFGDGFLLPIRPENIDYENKHMYMIPNNYAIEFVT